MSTLTLYTFVYTFVFAFTFKMLANKCKLPAFVPKDPFLWFRAVEANFAVHKVRAALVGWIRQNTCQSTRDTTGFASLHLGTMPAQMFHSVKTGVGREHYDKNTMKIRRLDLTNIFVNLEFTIERLKGQGVKVKVRCHW